MRETRPTAPERDRERDQLAAALPGYDIGAALGRGTFAVVYAARHRRLQREVAIKRLSPDLLREADARERFAAEARLLASLDHPHIVRVHDFVEEEEVCAFVMERLHGGTLGDRLARGRVAPAWAIAVTLGALHGLEHAHRQGVLHRDVKPDNLLFGDESHIKVADFGIAKVVGAQGARLTATAAAIGTPAYMAPEQVSRTAGPLSSATDVWAVGAVLYEMLAGEPPFALTGDLGEVLYARMTTDARPLRVAAPDVAPALADVVMRALSRDPAARYATPGEFAAALEPAADRTLAGGGLAATGIIIHRTTGAGGTPLLEQDTTPTLVPARPRRRRWWIAALAGVAIAAVAAIAVVLLAPGGTTTNASALPPAPPGWPKVMSAGFIDEVAGPAGAARRLGKGGTTFVGYGGDPAAKPPGDWSHDRYQIPPADFVRSAHRAGMFPYTTFYMLRALGQTGRGDDSGAIGLRKTLRSHRLMGIYWRNVRKFLQAVGSTGLPAAVSLDSNFWSTIEQHLSARAQEPASVTAWVGGSGVGELKGIPDTLQSIAAGWRTLRNRYAPKVVLGYEFDDWASAGIDIARSDPPLPTVVDSARQAAEFFLTVAANDLDFGALTIGDGAEEGQNPSEKSVYSPDEKEKVVAFVREFVRVADIPVVLEGVPLGNTVSQSITDTKYHWRDTWVQWLIGDNDFTGLRKLRDAGVVGVMFGVSGGENETCPCDAAHDGVTKGHKFSRPPTSADDDGGYFAERMAALRKVGGLSLER
ncbi:MAG TPA: serine/threonine-protein kinase [Solirubrobacteraceae bacterium]